MAPGMTTEALAAYVQAGEVVKTLKKSAAPRVRPGVKYVDLATFVEAETARLGARPAFPCNVSVNSVASHHTPVADSQESFRSGDVVKVDLGAVVDGYIADSAFTVEVETDRHRRLLEAASTTLASATESVRPGVTTGEIGRVIAASAAAGGFRVLRELYGHNMDRNCLHGGLTIPNYDDGSVRKIREGDVLAIEPFLTPGSGEITRSSGGNIFQVIRRDAIYAAGHREKELLEKLNLNYTGFPFASRWLGAENEALQGLVRNAAVKEYPMLIEKDGAPVAQAEHTLIVGRDSCKIIT